LPDNDARSCSAWHLINTRGCYRSRDFGGAEHQRNRINLIATSQVGQRTGGRGRGRGRGVGFADTRAEVYVRYLRGGGGTGTTTQLVSPGVLSCDGGGRGGGGKGRWTPGGDKYPSDIMDGACIRPQRDGGTNPISFRGRFRRRRRARRNPRSPKSEIDFGIDVNDKFALFRPPIARRRALFGRESRLICPRGRK